MAIRPEKRGLPDAADVIVNGCEDWPQRKTTVALSPVGLSSHWVLAV